MLDADPESMNLDPKTACVYAVHVLCADTILHIDFYCDLGNSTRIHTDPALLLQSRCHILRSPCLTVSYDDDIPDIYLNFIRIRINELK